MATPSTTATPGENRGWRAALAPAHKQRTWSLRRRLMWFAGITTLLAWLTGGVGALIAAYSETSALHDEHLSEIANEVLSLAGRLVDETRGDGRVPVIDSQTASPHSYQLWARSGALLLRSQDAEEQPYLTLEATGFYDREVGGRPHRIYATRNNDGALQVQVAEDLSTRTEFVPTLRIWLLVFFLASVAALLLLNHWLFGRAFRTLDESAAQLTDRSPHDLRQVDADNPPRELQPLLASLNGLFERIERAFESERQFTAAAAHELRTPLAAIRMQAQVASQARAQKEAQKSLDALLNCVDRASRMLDQLLMLARVESTSALRANEMKFVWIDPLAEQVVADLAPAIQTAGVEVDLRLAGGCIAGVEFALAALLRNLIDNALRHAAAGGHVLIGTSERDADVVLFVEDAGPGIPEHERDHVFERFYRLVGSEVEGCGVGLSIVRVVADVHGAKVELGPSTLGGLRVAITFPKPVQSNKAPSHV